MSDIKIKAKTRGLGRQGQGVEQDVPGTLEGAMFTTDLAYLTALNGDVYVANSRFLTDAGAFAGAYDADGPDFVIDVPLGTTIVPLKIDVYYESVGTTLLMETFASISTTLAGTTTKTGGGVVTPVNLRTGNSGTSDCTVAYSIDAAGCTAQSAHIYEIFRHGFQLAEDMAVTEQGWPEKQYTWSAAEEGFYPILDGESSLFVHAASFGGTGFITVVYYEIDTPSI